VALFAKPDLVAEPVMEWSFGFVGTDSVDLKKYSDGTLRAWYGGEEMTSKLSGNYLVFSHRSHLEFRINKDDPLGIDWNHLLEQQENSMLREHYGIEE